MLEIVLLVAHNPKTQKDSRLKHSPTISRPKPLKVRYKGREWKRGFIVGVGGLPNLTLKVKEVP